MLRSTRAQHTHDFFLLFTGRSHTHTMLGSQGPRRRAERKGFGTHTHTDTRVVHFGISIERFALQGGEGGWGESGLGLDGLIVK